MDVSVRDNRLWLKVYEWIKSGVFSGALAGGEPLSESMLAQETGISRTPIREALRVLARDGFVTLVPGKGAFVAEITLESIREIYEVRRLLEPYAARTAVMRILDDYLDRAASKWREIKSMINERRPVEWGEIADLDREFHLMITTNAANRRIRDILIPYAAQVERFQLMSAKALSDVGETARQHLQLIDCIRRRDGDELAGLMLEHIVSSEENVMKIFVP
ncbi:MAG: GntR family transcriptional regulator [Synergistaceae bacterium]|jgi:DNA-binding GntR family transcriptional regulator|nr:GntR family transcriptional regulator [Synergistaceae bacterium]